MKKQREKPSARAAVPMTVTSFFPEPFSERCCAAGPARPGRDSCPGPAPETSDKRPERAELAEDYRSRAHGGAKSLLWVFLLWLLRRARRGPQNNWRIDSKSN